MNITPIHNDSDHARALERVGALWDAQEGTPEANELEVLCVLIASYEEVHHVIAPPDPIEYLRFMMEQREWAPKDLRKLIGDSGRVSEVLNKKRSLTLGQIRRLAEEGLSPEILIREYSTSAA